MLRINVITLFPQLFSEHLNNLPFKRAQDKNLIEVKIWDLRKYALDSYGTVDDKPYGGGVGMVLMIEPIYMVLKDIYGLDPLNLKNTLDEKNKIIVMTPSGRKYTQTDAVTFSSLEQITIICGRYEGIDARVEQYLATDSISIGDFVVSGGEIPALAVMESITRLIPGVLEKEEATQLESFSSGRLEHPQYTRPEDFKGLKVPEILLSGDHKKIKEWRNSNSKKVA